METPTPAPTPDPSDSRKYGVPFYAAAWVPSSSFKSDQVPQQSENDRDQSADDADNNSLPSQPAPAADFYVAAAGGGGEGRSGISNALILAHFDFDSRSLSHQPVISLSLSHAWRYLSFSLCYFE